MYLCIFQQVSPTAFVDKSMLPVNISILYCGWQMNILQLDIITNSSGLEASTDMYMLSCIQYKLKRHTETKTKYKQSHFQESHPGHPSSRKSEPAASPQSPLTAQWCNHSAIRTKSVSKYFVALINKYLPVMQSLGKASLFDSDFLTVVGLWFVYHFCLAFSQ